MLHGAFAYQVTELGNVLVAGPMIAVMSAWLWCTGSRLVAVVLAVNTACAIVADIVLKEVARATGGGFQGTPFHLSTGAPSGHAVMSMMAYGGLAALFAIAARGLARIIGIALATALIAIVAVTRVTLHFHTPADVVTGLLLGSLFTALTAAVARCSARRWPAMLPLLFGVLGVGLLMLISGLRLTSANVM